MKGYTQNRQEVTVKDWAEEYEVGDTIRFEIPHKEKSEESEIVGFSTVPRNHGLPVVPPPKGYSGFTELAITKEYHLNGQK